MEDVAAELPMFPLSTVLFPGSILPLHIFEPRYRMLLRDVTAGDRSFGIVLIERGSEVGGGDVRKQVGTQAIVELSRELSDGRWAIIVRGGCRMRVQQWLEDDPYPRALVVFDDISSDDDRVQSDVELSARVDHAAQATRRAVALLSEAGVDVGSCGAALFDPNDDEEAITAERISPRYAAWQLCAQAPLTPFDAESLLEVEDDCARLERLAELMEALTADIRRSTSN